MDNTRSHYPANLRDSKESPYLSAIAPDSQNPKRALKFESKICHTFKRRHFNPPIWIDVHWHNFRVEIHLSAFCPASSLYAIDLVEAEKKVIAHTQLLPEIINDLQGYEYGATEDLCRYFSTLKWDKHITVLSVTVWETENRCTVLRI
jgi:hypothetical protein